MEDAIQKIGAPKHWIDRQHEEPENEHLEFAMNLLRIQNGGQSCAVDDVSGAALDPILVQAARQVEMYYFRRMKVYDKVHRDQAWGHKLIRTTWIDTNKGDHVKPDHRSRLVALEFNEYTDPSLFAATPPLEAMRYIVHRAATNRYGSNRHCMMTVDVSRAYFNAVSTRDVYIEIPKEDKAEGDECMVGKLRLCLYGTRDAAFNWSETVTNQ